MNSTEFCYWLQGWFELNKTIDHRDGASKETLDVIEQHLQLVFDKVTETKTNNSINDIDWDKVLSSSTLSDDIYC
jgi:hypothetical protein